MFCTRCGGILTEHHTIHDDGNGGKLHFYCSWKNWEEHKERLMKGEDHADKVRARDRNGNLLPRK